MVAPVNQPLPQSNFDWITGKKPTQAFAQWASAIDAAVRSLVGNLVGSPTQLTNAANDAAAAAAGVAIGQLYRNGSAVQVRVT